MNIAVIFAGGSGQRMRTRDIPKQFLEMHGKPIIIYTLEIFEEHPEIDAIVIACKKEWIDFLNNLLYKYRIEKVKKVVPGGETGQMSIYNGLVAASEVSGGEDAVVLIHDGVRPLITDELIIENIENVKKFGTSITCCSCFETPIISVDGEKIDEVLKRDTVYMAKAPQCFHLDEILQAHEKVRNTELGYNNKKIVDSCSLYMYIGNQVHLTEGNRENIKVTTVEDYISLLATLSVEDQKQIFMLKESEKK